MGGGVGWGRGMCVGEKLKADDVSMTNPSLFERNCVYIRVHYVYTYPHFLYSSFSLFKLIYNVAATQAQPFLLASTLASWS